MWTNQPFIFALICVTLLTALVLGWYVILIVLVLLFLVTLWMRLKHPREWKEQDYSIRIRGDALFAWIEYEEAGKKLWLRAEWAGERKPTLLIWIETSEYLAPDYAHPLTEEQLSGIQSRVSTGLKHLDVQHEFARLGWTSLP